MERKLRAVVCGLGKMGRAIVFSMENFGFHVVALDKDPDSAANMPFELFDFLVTPDEEAMQKAITLSNPDVVISSLPYHQNEKLAQFCIQRGYNYCDLGGRVDISKKINHFAMQVSGDVGGHCFTDLGLAPGWVNILAEHGIKQLYGRSNDIEEVKMMVGGLPQFPDNPPLNYSLSWSLDGLLNEYKDDCAILKNGKEISVKGMDGLEEVTTESLGELEAFYTSGGASHSIESMKERGVEHCSYKTLRYKGHGELIKFLIRQCKLDEDCLSRVFEPYDGRKPIQDLVIIKVMVKAKESSWEKELLIPHGKALSAMQKGTAFSIASVAKMMAEKFFDKNAPEHRDYRDLPPRALTYKNVDYEEFMRNINILRESPAVMDLPYEETDSKKMARAPHPQTQPTPSPSLAKKAFEEGKYEEAIKHLEGDLSKEREKDEPNEAKIGTILRDIEYLREHFPQTPSTDGTPPPTPLS